MNLTSSVCEKQRVRRVRDSFRPRPGLFSETLQDRRHPLVRSQGPSRSISSILVGDFFPHTRPLTTSKRMPLVTDHNQLADEVGIPKACKKEDQKPRVCQANGEYPADGREARKRLAGASAAEAVANIALVAYRFCTCTISAVSAVEGSTILARVARTRWYLPCPRFAVGAVLTGTRPRARRPHLDIL